MKLLCKAKKYFLIPFTLIVILTSCEKEPPITGYRYDAIPIEDQNIKIDKSLTEKQIKLKKATIQKNYNNSSATYKGINHKISSTSESLPPQLNLITSKRIFKKGTRFKPNQIQPLVVNNVLYYLDNKGIFYAVSILDNQIVILWKNEEISLSNNHVQYGGLAYSEDGNLIVSNGSNIIYKISTQDGSIIWQNNVDHIVNSAPIILDQYIYFMSLDNNLIKLSLKDGKFIWKTSNPNKNNVSIAQSSLSIIDKNKVLAAFSNGILYNIDAKDQTLIWKTDLSDKNHTLSNNYVLNDVDAGMIINNDVAYVASLSGFFRKISTKDATVIWENKLNISKTPLEMKNFLFALDDNYNLYAIDKEKGSIKWESSLTEVCKEKKKKFRKKKNNPDIANENQEIAKTKPRACGYLSAPIMINSQIWVFGSKKKAFIFSAETGDFLSSISIRNKIFAAPIIINESIYIIDNSGKLSIYNLNNRR